MIRTTSILVAIAVVTVIGAFWMAPKPLPPATFEDTGEPLFADFTDPTAATSLEVVEWDKDSAKLKRFKVEQKGGRWLIPSHNDYPADGAAQMGKAAASFIGIKRDIYYGDKAEEHGKFGVLTPDSTEGEEDGRGQRITLGDASGGKLVDVIVGKEIPDKQGFRYVRFPEQKRVYGSRLELDVSTEFTKWIEKDLLRMIPEDVVEIRYDPYQVDEARGQVTESKPVFAQRSVDAAAGGGAASGSDWQITPADQLGGQRDGQRDGKPSAKIEVPAGKVLDSWKVQQVLNAVDGLQIVGVRPRPNPLTLGALQSKGFFVTQDGRQLFGNEGEISAITENGVVYKLYFGEVTFDSGLALTAGVPTPEPKSPDDTSGEAPDDTKDGKANRYMFVDVRYDPAFDKSAAEAEKKAADAKAADAKAADAKAPDGKAADAKAPDKAADAKPAEVPGAANRAEAKRLQERFDKWFYVISDDSFKRIHVPRDEFFKDVPEDDKAK